MKLAEALITRSNLQKRIDGLREKLLKYSKVQDGDEPPENPDMLYKEISDCYDEVTSLIQRINKTNSAVMFDEERTIADTIAFRDVLVQRYNTANKLVASATDVIDRYSTKEIKIKSSVDVKMYQKTANKFAKDYRELDMKIQEKNWAVELM